MSQPPKKLGILASDIVERELDYLVDDYYARGELVQWDGGPGVGKSSIICQMGADLSRGRDPFGRSFAIEPGAIIYLAAEDRGDVTLIKRLRKHDADLSKIEIVPYLIDREFATEKGPIVIRKAPFSVCDPRCLKLLEQKIVERKVIATFFDPFFQYLDGDVDTNSDSAVRQAMIPVAMIAECTNSIIVCVRHFNKNVFVGDASMGGSGSGAFGSLARIHAVIGFHPSDHDKPEIERRRVFAPVKRNDGPKPPARAFFMIVEKGDKKAAPLISWEPEPLYDITADDLVAVRHDKKHEDTIREQPARTEAKELLGKLLADHKEHLSKAITKDAEQAGITWKTLVRAAKDMGVRMRKIEKAECCNLHIDDLKLGEKGTPWVWMLPVPEPEPEPPPFLGACPSNRVFRILPTTPNVNGCYRQQ
jgi:RecA-family ATPase